MTTKARSAKRYASSARGKRVGESATPMRRHRPDHELDFSDIPELTPNQLKDMRRVGRPPEGRAAKELIAIRLDPDVLLALRSLADRKGVGYQTLIQNVLARAVRRDRAVRRRAYCRAAQIAHGTTTQPISANQPSAVTLGGGGPQGPTPHITVQTTTNDQNA